jgi:hypothetical protein
MLQSALHQAVESRQSLGVGLIAVVHEQPSAVMRVLAQRMQEQGLGFEVIQPQGLGLLQDLG